MTRHRRVHRTLQALEPRTLPAAILGAPLAGVPSAASAEQHSAASQTTSHQGMIRGKFTTPMFQGIDSGITTHFTGDGSLFLLGAVTLTGTLQGTGNIQQGQANGTVTLKNSLGSVTLELVGPTQGMFAPLPGQFKFSVITTTGAFHGLKMTGTAYLAENSQTSAFSLKFVSNQTQDPTLLAGKGSGNYVPGFVTDAGPLVNLNGTASLGTLGKVTVSGSVQGTGFTQQGRAYGVLTLRSAQGTVKLQLLGPVQPGFSPLPQQFQFTVLDATGAYSGLKLTGTIGLTLSPPTTSITPTSLPGGTFQLTITPDPKSVTTL